jgi:hypothetical protein
VRVWPDAAGKPHDYWAVEDAKAREFAVRDKAVEVLGEVQIFLQVRVGRVTRARTGGGLLIKRPTRADNVNGEAAVTAKPM